eukprot:6116598-Lingulodinium_polyedra.AAC.1
MDMEHSRVKQRPARKTLLSRRRSPSRRRRLRLHRHCVSLVLRSTQKRTTNGGDRQQLRPQHVMDNKL